MLFFLEWGGEGAEEGALQGVRLVREEVRGQGRGGEPHPDEAAVRVQGEGRR